VLDVIRDELTRTCQVSHGALSGLQTIVIDPEISLSGRVKKSMAHLKANPGLSAIHALLTDMGMRKGEALEVMTRLIEIHLAMSPGADNSNPVLSDMKQIADLLGQPQLKPASSQAVGAIIDEALKRR
jgi:hypothetical protein